jgi:LysM repeat protein
MAIRAARVSVTTTAIALADGGSKNGVRARIYNATGPEIYLGGLDATAGTVTASTGFAVAGTSSVDYYVDAGETLYGIAAAGTATVHVLRGGVES